MPTPTLVLDFDGTVALGDDPVWFYAEEIARRADAERARRIRTGLAAFLAGDRPTGNDDDVLADVEDGYQAVLTLARPIGLDVEQLGAAYLDSRRRLAAGEGEVRAPHGLRDLLAELRAQGVRVVLVTNSPAVGVTEWLATVGLADQLDRVVAEAGKPAGMPAVLRSLLAEAGAEQAPQYLLSVGDVWANDVEAAIGLGCGGLYIDRFGTGRGPSTASAATIAELYPTVRAWAADPRSVVQP